MEEEMGQTGRNGLLKLGDGRMGVYYLILCVLGVL